MGQGSRVCGCRLAIRGDTCGYPFGYCIRLVPIMINLYSISTLLIQEIHPCPVGFDLPKSHQTILEKSRPKIMKSAQDSVQSSSTQKQKCFSSMFFSHFLFFFLPSKSTIHKVTLLFTPLFVTKTLFFSTFFFFSVTKAAL